MTGYKIKPGYHQVRNTHRRDTRSALLLFVNPEIDQTFEPWIKNESNAGIDIIERANESLGLVTAARFAEPNYYDVVGITVTVRQEAEARMMIRANAIHNNKPIEDPKVYQNFFATLERSLFVTKE